VLVVRADVVEDRLQKPSGFSLAFWRSSAFLSTVSFVFISLALGLVTALRLF
jgi:hypothetical protein